MWSIRKYDAIDGRLLEARAEKQLIKDLTEHVGGRPSVTQALLIKRVARSVVILSILEKRVLESGDLGDLHARQIVALWNFVRSGLDKLGLKSPEQKTPELTEFLAIRGRPRAVA